MTVQVGELKRKRVVRKMDGSIIDWSDDTDGSGKIIDKGRVVNQQKIDEYVQKEKDKEMAAKAESLQVVREDAPDRTVNPTKQAELEKKVEGLESDIKQILAILTDKKNGK